MKCESCVFWEQITGNPTKGKCLKLTESSRDINQQRDPVGFTVLEATQNISVLTGRNFFCQRFEAKS